VPNDDGLARCVARRGASLSGCARPSPGSMEWTETGLFPRPLFSVCKKLEIRGGGGRGPGGGCEDDAVEVLEQSRPRHLRARPPRQSFLRTLAPCQSSAVWSAALSRSAGCVGSPSPRLRALGVAILRESHLQGSADERPQDRPRGMSRRRFQAGRGGARCGAFGRPRRARRRVGRRRCCRPGALAQGIGLLVAGAWLGARPRPA
jgi:hypothetical protein